MKPMGRYAIDEHRVDLDDFLAFLHDGQRIVRVQGNPHDAILPLDGGPMPRTDSRSVQEPSRGERAVQATAVVLSVLAIVLSVAALLAP